MIIPIGNPMEIEIFLPRQTSRLMIGQYDMARTIPEKIEGCWKNSASPCLVIYVSLWSFVDNLSSMLPSPSNRQKLSHSNAF